jgi:hypothetical protein
MCGSKVPFIHGTNCAMNISKPKQFYGKDKEQ